MVRRQVEASCRHQDIVADNTHRVGADAPFGFDCGGAGGEFETPLMPRTVDELHVANHDGVTGNSVVVYVAAAQPADAERAAFVRAVVRYGIESAVDVVDADAVAADRHDYVCPRG